jgi:hypothetical protein
MTEHNQNFTNIFHQSGPILTSLIVCVYVCSYKPRHPLPSRSRLPFPQPFVYAPASHSLHITTPPPPYNHLPLL